MASTITANDNWTNFDRTITDLQTLFGVILGHLILLIPSLPK